MPRRKSEQMTPLELEIMQVLWETGPATVQTVQRELKRELAYTTVQTMLTVLHRKGRVKRTLKDKAYVYRPAVSSKKFTAHAVRDLIDRVFGGSAGMDSGRVLRCDDHQQLGGAPTRPAPGHEAAHGRSA